MISSTKGPAPAPRSETAGAVNRCDTAPHPVDHVVRTHTLSGMYQRERDKARLIGHIKQAIAELVLATGEAARIKNSAYLSQRLNYNYTYLANRFSAATGCTIEQYIIACKIDRVKELLLASELTLAQLADKLNYSSVAHLANQFKKVTGLTPSAFRKFHWQHGKLPESGNVVTVFYNRVSGPEVRRMSFTM